MVEKVSKIWMDGTFVNWDDANVHILTHTLHYGLGAFEGIRSYKRETGDSAIFRLEEHIQRLIDSLRIVSLKCPFEKQVLMDACRECLEVNGLDEAYVRPLAYVGDGAMGLYAPGNPVRVAIVAWRWGAYLGEAALAKGIRAHVSSFNRNHVNAGMSKGKIIGQYVNSIMAKQAAKAAGYDEAIMLDTAGYVAEASGENMFLVKNGVIKTPPYSSAILGGITRDSVIRLARDLGYQVKPTLFTRDEMYIADEIFMCGTAAEVTPVTEIDNRPIGSGLPGPVTKNVQARFFDILRGRCHDYAEWLTPYKIA